MTIRKKQSNFMANRGLKFEVLSPDELDAIHTATLEIMWERGVVFGSRKAREVLCDHGCWADKDDYVHFPAYIVEDTIASAPSQIIAHGRNPEKDVLIGANRTNYTNFGQGVQIIDTFTRERRPTVKQDVGDISRAVDALENIHILHRPVQAHDTPESISQLHNLEAMIHNCVKPLQIGLVEEYTTKKVIEMAAILAGGRNELKSRPPLILGTCPISPLQLSSEACDVIMAVAEAGMPYNTISMVQPGATAPATMAGSIVVFNAEMLAQNALLQLVNKGTPFLYGTSHCLMDMKLGLSAVGAPEAALGNAVGVELAKRYKLPCYLAGG